MENGFSVVIVGVRGMLGTALRAACAADGIPAEGLDIEEVDIAQPRDLPARIPRSDWIVNCAAYTQVDAAETDRDRAMAVNRDGAANLARLAADRGSALLHIGTDHVFDGALARPYREDDAPNPANYYGLTKLEGERAIRAAMPRHLIVRTQALFGARRRTFVSVILDRLRDGAPVRVVNDQTTCPTHVAHLAAAILRLLRAGRFGIVHVSASGSCTWFDFAQAIAARAMPGARVTPVRTGEYPAPARRPPYSVLDKSRYESWTGHAFPAWQEGLELYFEEAAASGKGA